MLMEVPPAFPDLGVLLDQMDRTDRFGKSDSSNNNDSGGREAKTAKFNKLFRSSASTPRRSYDASFGSSCRSAGEQKREGDKTQQGLRSQR